MPPGRFRRLPACIVEVLVDVETAGLDVFVLDPGRLQGSQDAVHRRQVVLLSLLYCRSIRLDTQVHMGGIWYKRLLGLSLIHISEPTRLGMISYAVFCLKKKKKKYIILYKI